MEAADADDAPPAADGAASSSRLNPRAREFVPAGSDRVLRQRREAAPADAFDPNQCAVSAGDEADPVPVPAGYRLLPCPHADLLLHRSAPVGRSAARSMVGCPVLVLWPQHGWCVGHVRAIARVGELDRGQQANFVVDYCEDPSRPGVPTAHAAHNFTTASYAQDAAAPGFSWVLLTTRTGEGDSTRGCGWPGCPGHSMPFTAVRLLQHARQAHGGQLDDARMTWACAQRCPTCAMPFAAGTLGSHMRRDPADGVQRCPTVLRASGGVITLTRADEAFVRGLTADEVYIQSVPSLISLDKTLAREVGLLVAPLMQSLSLIHI